MEEQFKRDKIKRVGLYQNYDKGGLRMPDLECMIKALRMAWIPRLLKEGHQNWKTVPDHFFKRYGGLEFILSCNYNVKFFENLPNFYKDILLYFSELKTLYNHDNMCETILFNNKDILIGGKPFFNKEWFSRRIISITDLLDAEGRFLSFSDFQSKYRLRRTNFLQFYQVINAIPKYLLAKSINKKLFAAESDDFVLDPTSFCLESGVKLDLTKMKSKDFYWLLINKTYMDEQTGVKRWNEVMPMEKTLGGQSSAQSEQLAKRLNYENFSLRSYIEL